MSNDNANYICPECGSDDLAVVTATITLETPLDPQEGTFDMPRYPGADDVWVCCRSCAEQANISAFEEAAQEANA
jgi:hypothetical protein